MRRQPRFQSFRKAKSVLVPKHTISPKLAQDLLSLQRGGKGRENESEYALGVRHLRILKALYGGIQTKSLRYIAHQQGKPNLLSYLESRADVVLFRSCFVPSLWSAQQLIAHGHVQLNHRDLQGPGTILRPGDLLTITAERPHAWPFFGKRAQHLEVDFGASRVIYLWRPQSIELPAPFDFDAAWKGLIV
uniref:Ribosomal protein S4 n=1 Tax=Chloropicon maureeniae TaxID=1461542 RepID=A0A4D6C623_9CHLO|nr:ribosomal protein S4 [Chloropicon maureeniae]QBX98827.1 ribosomal protein S4 [Chloropicon maureeniae]